MRFFVRSSVLVVAVLWCIQSDAYIYGYTRLFHPSHNTTVDLLYDIHEANTLSVEQMMFLPLSWIKEHLHLTEKRLIEALQAINESPEAKDTALIWELGPPDTDFYARPVDSNLIGFGTVVESSLPRIEFVRGDTQRKNLALLCLCPERSSDCSLNSPVSLIPEDYRLLEKRYGVAAAQELKRRYDRKNNDFKYLRLDTFCSFGPPASSYQFAKPMAEITDLEMVSHLLLSPKKRIIVYCGGFHAQEIRPLLTDFFGFEILSHEAPKLSRQHFQLPAEIDVDKLNFLDS